MSSEEHEVYIMEDEDGDEWVSPTPASVAIVEAVCDETGLDEDDLDDLDTYLDIDELDAVLNGDEDSLEFAVEDYDVTVDDSGDIDVAE